MNTAPSMERTTIARFFKSFLFLARNLSMKDKASEKHIPMQPKCTERHSVYDLYEPPLPAEKTVVVVHGLTLQGEKDHRLIHFSKTLAASGIRAAAIGLPGLKKCRFTPDDTHTIADLVRELFRLYQQKIGIVGFSLGGGLALVAASRADVGDMMGPLLLLGPHYDFREIWRGVLDIHRSTPRTIEEWDNFIWIHLILAYRAMGSLPRETRVHKEIESFLTHYCRESSLSRKQEFYRKYLTHPTVFELVHNHLEPADETVLTAISPAHQLRSIQSRVFLLHGRNDPLVPPAHSRCIYRELLERGRPDAQRMLITPLLSHVRTRGSYRIFDMFPLLKILGEIFR